MKIYAISVVKNEEDIIEYSLNHAATWADKVIVYDNGSTDKTWEKILSMKSSIIVPFRQNNKPYSDGLRADIFNAFKGELEDGDWWVIQDSDEIFEENPRDFIMRQKGDFHHINGKKIDFCFDLSQLESLNFSGNFSTDIKLFNFYTPEAWSEPRAIKHRKKLAWEVKEVWPKHMGLVCLEAIKIRHYPLRSAEQMRKRWETRFEVKKRGGQSFDHWEKLDWKEYYSKKAKEQTPFSKTDEVFDQVKFMNDYKQSFIKRTIKRILHSSKILP